MASTSPSGSGPPGSALDDSALDDSALDDSALVFLCAVADVADGEPAAASPA